MGSSTETLVTVRDWLSWAVDQFNEADLYFGHGCDNAVDEAAWLISHALNIPFDFLDSSLERNLDPRERAIVLELLNRRVSERIPAAYLTRKAWLGHFDFYVDERVIVPRSYFAELLDEGLEPWLPNESLVSNALDLCTGSACLAILMALAYPDARVDAIDISREALSVARINVDRYQLADRIDLFESDLFDGVGDRCYDLIISNPPYVTSESMAILPEEYRHEPALALAAGSDGLDIVRRILSQASVHLTNDGVLLVEVGHNASLVEAAFPKVPFTWIDTLTSEGKIFLLTKPDLIRYFE